MYLTIIIGQTGQGKSTLAKRMIKGRPHIVYDVNNEYAKDGFKTYFTPDVNEFINFCLECRGVSCVFEEATAFFKGRLASTVDKLIINKRHTDNRYIFLFHSIQSVPPQLFLLANYCILLKTNDVPTTVAKKYPQLYRPFISLQNAPQYTHRIIKMI